MAFIPRELLIRWLEIGLIGLAYKFILHPALFSPLSKIPAAHPLAPWTSLWILYIRLTKGENQIIYNAHCKLGPLVRLGPHEVSLNSTEGLRKIYVGNYDKHQWFANAGMVNGVPNAFSSLDSKSHAQSRRLVTGVYSKSSLQSSNDVATVFEEIISNRLVPTLRKAAKNGESVDAISLSEATASDIATALIYGLDAATNIIRDIDAREELRKDHDTIRPWFNFIGELTWLVEIFGLVGIKLVPLAMPEKFGNIVSRVSKMCKTSESSERSKGTIYDRCLRAFNDASFPPERILAEMFDQTIASFDTTAITFTYLFYELSRNFQLQARLRREVSTIANGGHLPEARELDSLPLLHAIVYETLRRYSPASMPLPRVVPKEGAYFNDRYIPEGVRVSCNAYTLHRNERVFKEPEKWDPERWLIADEEQLTEMRRWFWAFGSGARMCIGIHFAIQELKYVTVAVYKNFETEITTAGDMAQLDGFLAGPAGHKLDIKFREMTE